MKYKKIIICSSGRINLNDTSNNSLLFRNLLKNWPKDRIAQIFNSGSNGDPGFFTNYYQYSENDRHWGKYYSIISKKDTTHFNTDNKPIKRKASLYPFFRKLLIDTGWYELVFRPKLSCELKKWLNDFKPELILIQGYSLTYTKFPLLIKKYTNAKLVFFTTDDWPKYLYNGSMRKFRLLSLLPRIMVNRVVKKLIRETDIPIAFGYPMQEEYNKRYGKSFYSIIHCDSPVRFENATPKRLYDESILEIITIGTFNKQRCPMISDVNECCRQLDKEGIKAKLAIISNCIEPEYRKIINNMQYVNIYNDPGHEELPSLLKGADILLLIESFDNDTSESIRLSISTKAHLFMFSQKPIIVYSNPITGIANYAKKYQWAITINTRDSIKLKNIIYELALNIELREKLIQRANKIAFKFHDINKVQKEFISILNN